MKVLPGGCADGEIIKKTLKMHSKTLPKSMEIDATFVLKRAMKTTWKRVPKRMPQLFKICPKTNPENQPKKKNIFKTCLVKNGKRVIIEGVSALTAA